MTEAGDIQIVKERSVLLGAFCYLLNTRDMSHLR